jgi:2-isopropylmalate synthase
METKTMTSVELYDTTLRDGTQMAGMSLSCDDKLRIAQALDQLGINMVEGGWPGSNPKDVEFFARARDLDWSHARIAAFGATRRTNVAVEDDANLRSLLDAGTPVCTIFGKTSPLHVTEVLRTTYETNLQLIEESVAYLKAHGKHVVYDAEHFFDGYRADPAYAVETLRAALAGGADVVALCDTNGGSLPWEVASIVRELLGDLRNDGLSTLGVHTHDDCGCAVANSIAAVDAGAAHVQGTINGYGERCGNANLCSIVPNLELKLGRSCLPAGSLAGLTDVSRLVAEIANQAPNDYQAYVGRNAFAHKGGVHVAAMRRNREAYHHVDPEEVGNEMRVVVSELSGRANLISKAEEYGTDQSLGVGDVLREIKENEARGFSYEAAEASVALMLARQEADYSPPFRLLDYMVTVEHRDRRGTFAEATVKLRIGDEVVHTAAEGNGPVAALDTALRKALLPVYPQLGRLKLVDYKVRILDSGSATGATTRVLVDTTDGLQTWGTVGASANIIEASWRALADAVEYGLRLCRETLVERPASSASAP